MAYKSGNVHIGVDLATGTKFRDFKEQHGFKSAGQAIEYLLERCGNRTTSGREEK